jgi:hypothetical protein
VVVLFENDCSVVPLTVNAMVSMAPALLRSFVDTYSSYVSVAVQPAGMATVCCSVSVSVPV